MTSVSVPTALSKATAKIFINGMEADSLIDSGRTESFIHPNLVKLHPLKVNPSNSRESMASSSLSAKTEGCSEVSFTLGGRDYRNASLSV